MSNNGELKKLILREFHVNPYSSQPGYQKTLIAVKNFYYLSNILKEVADFMVRCLYSQQVKEKCKHPGGLLQLIPTLEWKWKVISMDFITGLSRTSR